MPTCRALSTPGRARRALLAAALALGGGGCAHRAAARVEGEPVQALIGVQVRTLAEGLLVEGVRPGSGAALAGLQPGDLLLSVDGVEVRAGPEAARSALAGPPGSHAELVVRGPGGGEYREVRAERGVASAATGPGGDAAEDPVEALVAALRRGRPGAVRRAAAAVRARPSAGLAPAASLGDQLAPALRRARRERPAAARAAAEALAGAAPDDPSLRLALGEIWHDAGALEVARLELQRAEALRPADVWEPGAAWRGDAGGNPTGRALLAQTLWSLQARDEGIAVARDLLRSWELPGLAAATGMAPERATVAWQAAIPPEADFSVQTLAGTPWSLEEHRGKLVVISFFATWCAPCRPELQALDALRAAHPGADLEVLAVSMDDAADVDQLPALAGELALSLPIAHAPAVGRRFGVEALPSLRVIGRDGTLALEGSGWSEELLERVEQLVRAPPQDQPATSVLGQAWVQAGAGGGRASLAGFLALPGTHDLVLTASDLAIGRDDGPPVVMAGDGPGSASTVEGPGGGELLAWLDGPVVAAAGQRWIRATTATGRPRWLATTAAPVRALAHSGALLWVATDDEVLALDALGRVEVQRPGGARAVAPAPEGGVWLVDGLHRLRLDARGRELARDEARGAALVDSAGRVASRSFEDLLTGRFGPDGAARTVVARFDGTVVGLDGDGAPAFTWQLDVPGRLAAGDIDGDGQDELLIAVRRRGLTTVTLSLP